MENNALHDWRTLLLTPLDAEAMGAKLPDDNPDWEWLDAEMVKLGSLNHAHFDLGKVQQTALGLLSQRSKDIRVISHLLRTLQQGASTQDLLLGLTLWADYVSHFWQQGWPKAALQKRRFAQQILKRFQTAAQGFNQQATEAECSTARQALQRLLACWQPDEPELAEETEALIGRYARSAVVSQTASSASSTVSHSPAIEGASPTRVQQTAPMPTLLIDEDISNDRNWRQTLLKVADLICTQQAGASVGYRLRRYAIWQNITAAPQAREDGRTPLAAIDADRVMEYKSNLTKATPALWTAVENSLTLAPYWFDGHQLSAQIASQLGYETTAEAIRQELAQFLARVPQLKSLCFSDMTPFLSPATAQWLEAVTGAPAGAAAPAPAQDDEEVWHCFQQQGLEAALQRLEQQPTTEPRQRFYQQLLGAQLLEQAGMSALAYQQYQTLRIAGQTLTLTEWEPGLLALLETKSARQDPPGH